MGVRLMVEVLDHWSDFGLTSGERSDLLVIAENANDKTRCTFGGIHEPYILRRAGNKSATSWRNTVHKLMKKGALEYAVKDGRPIVGYRGQAAVYRIPHLCPLRSHDGLWGQCERDPESVTSQVTHSEEGHSSGDTYEGKGHPTDDTLPANVSPHRGESVTSQVTPTPPTPVTTSADAEGANGEDGAIPGMDVKPSPKKKPKPKKPAKPPTPAQIEARKITDGYFKKYGNGSGQTDTAVRMIVLTALNNGTDRDIVAWAVDAIGRTGKSVTAWRLTDAIADVRARRGETADSMASRRTAAECSEHHMPLPCAACLADLRAGDDEVPRRLLAEHGPQARPDLAERLNQNGAAA